MMGGGGVGGVGGWRCGGWGVGGWGVGVGGARGLTVAGGGGVWRWRGGLPLKKRGGGAEKVLVMLKREGDTKGLG